MEKTFESLLTEFISANGISVLDNPNRFKSLFLDFTQNECRIEAQIFSQFLASPQANELKNCDSADNQVLNDITERFYNASGFDKGKCELVVSAYAEVLGVKGKTVNTAQPKPEPKKTEKPAPKPKMPKQEGDTIWAQFKQLPLLKKILIFAVPIVIGLIIISITRFKAEQLWNNHDGTSTSVDNIQKRVSSLYLVYYFILFFSSVASAFVTSILIKNEIINIKIKLPFIISSFVLCLLFGFGGTYIFYLLILISLIVGIIIGINKLMKLISKKININIPIIARVLIIIFIFSLILLPCVFVIRRTYYYPEHNQVIYSGCSAISHDGNIAASGYDDGTLSIWDIKTGNQINKIYGHMSRVSYVDISPDGKQIVSTSNDNTIKIWDIGSGKEIRTLTGHEKYIHYAIFSPDGRNIISTSGDKTILWDTVTGNIIWTHYSIYNSLNFSPDGKQIIAGYAEYIFLFDAATGNTIKSFTHYDAGEYKPLYSLCFSPDGKYILAGSSCYKQNISWEFSHIEVKLWEISSERLINTYYPHEAYSSSGDGGPASLVFASDGRQFYSYANGELILLNVGNGDRIKYFPNLHFNYLNLNSDLSYDNKRIFSYSSGYGGIILLDTATGEMIANFVSFKDGEWLIKTPDDYYKASSNGHKFQIYDMSLLRTFYYFSDQSNADKYQKRLEKYKQQYYKPEIIEERLNN